MARTRPSFVFVLTALLCSSAVSHAATLEAEARKYLLLRDVGQYRFTEPKPSDPAQSRSVRSWADAGPLNGVRYPGGAKHFTVRYVGTSKLLNDPVVTVVVFDDSKWLLHEVMGVNRMMDSPDVSPVPLGKSFAIGHHYERNPEGVAWVSGNKLIETAGAHRFRAREVVEAYLKQYPSEVGPVDSPETLRWQWATNETTRLNEHVSRALDEKKDSIFPKGRWIYIHGELMTLQTHLVRFWPDRVEARLTNEIYRGLEKLKELALANNGDQFRAYWTKYQGWWKRASQEKPKLPELGK